MGVKSIVKNKFTRLFTGKCWLWFCLIQLALTIFIPIYVAFDIKVRKDDPVVFIAEIATLTLIFVEIIITAIVIGKKVLKSKFFIADLVLVIFYIISMIIVTCNIFGMFSKKR